MERLRSSSIGSLSRESRIAALSVHLRTRLSYAAAKIEKTRQMQKAQDLPPTARIDSLVRSGQLAYFDQVDAQHPEGLGSPASTTMSSPDMYGTAGFNRPVGSARLSPAAWSEAATSPHAGFSRNHYHHHHYSHSHIDHSTRPKLAPPVDIISKEGSHGNRRRRPNPDEFISPPTFTHRRHHSHQDVGLSQSSANSDTILVPGTPPLQPSGPMPSARHGGGAGEQHDRARSSAMEQDAIETLLFMSSPGHSGYYSTHSQHSRRHQHQHVPRSSNGSQESSLRVPWSQPSYPGSTHGHGQPRAGSAEEVTGLEAQAGDEIDRMLDQMDSDSEDDAVRSRR
ncbi:hypothetical protein BO82DRAFT_296664 [Aspergillus uvarum CBS 121591]|uniref:Uncharacterized protein n=1 Tax=Aspergillus uvarum CBS 121591 TaxID=1448315 RepID=A0A319BV17_9EURO|nr:hypothetical protein BO82DRAFT_296664 [Aspergillus uvarum CBS 121591]PYH76261.1 hypothetical protein BO82DRAFT_296664 [Aspergillus uvarum CBS 121591]